MDLLIKLVLVLLYPLLLLGRVLNGLFGRDPLRVHEPVGATCWVERSKEPSRTSYFSEASETDARNHRGFGRPAAVVLGWFARPLAPPSKSAEEDFRAADRDQKIPDEIYTLW